MAEKRVTKKKKPSNKEPMPDRRTKIKASRNEANKKTRADVPSTKANKAATGKIQGGQSGKKG